MSRTRQRYLVTISFSPLVIFTLLSILCFLAMVLIFFSLLANFCSTWRKKGVILIIVCNVVTGYSIYALCENCCAFSRISQLTSAIFNVFPQCGVSPPSLRMAETRVYLHAKFPLLLYDSLRKFKYIDNFCKTPQCKISWDSFQPDRKTISVICPQSCERRLKCTAIVFANVHDLFRICCLSSYLFSFRIKLLNLLRNIFVIIHERMNLQCIGGVIECSLWS
jgi:hypothetical protein